MQAPTSEASHLTTVMSKAPSSGHAAAATDSMDEQASRRRSVRECLWAIGRPRCAGRTAGSGRALSAKKAHDRDPMDCAAWGAPRHRGLDFLVQRIEDLAGGAHALR
jgi:hypothetical protein